MPITRARRPGVDRPADFIGLHFFSPVDKMPLGGDHPRRADLGRGAGQGVRRRQQIRKTPIVVNDSRGFYTSRVIGTMVNEGLAMLARECTRSRWSGPRRRPATRSARCSSATS
jgi:3-hydroxyacyl-CoA dehydrogenase/enoyl-CoA hydratase/3-hydroxybutyryl-CoA epimerase